MAHSQYNSRLLSLLRPARMSLTFFWHDYETFGAVPRRDRPSQFAGIRTDENLNEIGDPVMLYCQPAPDYLPSPEACLLTGITPQICQERGVSEAEFAAVIESELATPGTIGVGYNSIRFDDEVTRHLFWRTLRDPYAREWQNHCSRWDLLDVVRTCFALRPEGIQWPMHEDGRPSFKLEDLSRANGLLHEAAHDALSDVRATIALARLIRDRQPKLFDFCLALRKKERVQEEIGLPQKKPFIHISGMFGVERGCTAIVWPLAMHPTNKNEVIVWDLAFDPAELATLDAETARLRMFTKASDLPDGMTRLPVKTIHINKSPIVIGNLKVLSDERAGHWGIDKLQALRHAEWLTNNEPAAALWAQVFQRDNGGQKADVDEDLYGGFVGNNDRRVLNRLLELDGAALAAHRPSFADARLDELLFRFRARNYPDTLSESETQRWQQHCVAKLIHGEGNARTLQAFMDELETLFETVSENGDERSEAILEALSDYAELIAPEY